MSNLFAKLTNLFDQDFMSFEEGKPIFDWLNKHKEDINSIEKSYLDYFKQLKQQLAEKDVRIEELECQFAYECECNMQLVDLQKQLEEKQKTIDEINREFVQAVHDWKTLCAEKDKEIERLKQELEETNAGYDFTYEQSTETIKELKQNQIQLAIQELEKTKDLLLNESKNNPIIYDVNDDLVGGAIDKDAVFKIIDQQIKELRGE